MFGLATSPETDVGPVRHAPHLSDHALPRAGPQRALIEQVTEPVETIRAQACAVVFCRPSAVPIAEPRAGPHDELLEPVNDLRMGIPNRDATARLRLMSVRSDDAGGDVRASAKGSVAVRRSWLAKAASVCSPGEGESGGPLLRPYLLRRCLR